MTNQPSASSPASENNASTSPPPPAASDAGAEPAAPAKPLTAEEQLALYEESLKESDWGHQPC